MKSEKNKKIFQKINGSTVAVYDLETQGLDASSNGIIEITLVKFKVDDNKWNEIERLDTYIKPDDGCVWSPEAAALMVEAAELNPEGKVVSPVQLADEFLADKPTEKEVFPKVYKFLEDVDIVIGHNILTFDNKFMRIFYARNGHAGEFRYDENNSADTLCASRDIVPKAQAVNNSHKLCNMAEYYNIEQEGNFHDSLTDVLTCAKLAEKLVSEYEEWDDVETEWSDPSLVPEVRYVSLFVKNYKTVNFLYVTLADGSKYRFNRAKLSWDIVDRKSPYCLDNVIKAVYKYTGCENEQGLAFWKPYKKAT